MPLNPNRKYYTAVISSYVFFLKEDKILLSRRYQTGYRDGEYSLPAGHTDLGEYASEGAIREIKEEVGVSIRKEDLTPAHIMHRHCGDHERTDFFFSTKKWDGDLVNCEPEKCDQIEWFPIENLPENTVPYIREAIKSWHSGNFYSEFNEG